MKIPRDRMRILLLAGVCLLLASGFKCDRAQRTAALPPNDEPQVGGVSDSIAVDVYLDATLSMKGFIVPGVSSNYERTLQLLERAAQKGWNHGTATFYKFGTRIDPVGGRGYLEGSRPDFYTNPDLYRRTFIENVIDAANPDNLTVVVTDLFQNAADVSLLTRKLKEKYLEKGLAVGVLGVRSHFDGTVYDVGIRNYSFPYKSGSEQAERFRPFYVLILGRHPDVARYFETLKVSGLEGFPTNFEIFSRHLATRLASFSDGRVEAVERMVQVSNLLAAGVQEGRAKQFVVREGTPPHFAATFGYEGLPYVMPFPAGALSYEVTAWHCAGDRLEGSGAPPQAFHVTGAALTGDRITLEAQVDASALAANEIYCYRVVLRPREYQAPAWVTEWDMPVENVEHWKQKPADFNGATTFNLKPFLEDLSETVVQLYQPKVGEVYFYFQKR
ncbi:MAG: hypothetical protein ACJ754_21195 [Pyrinomonadaceae bacterium]